MRAGAQHHLHAVGRAHGQRVGQVFLERHAPLERAIGGQVHEAEAAGRDDALDLVLVEPRAGQQRIAAARGGVAGAGLIGRGVGGAAARSGRIVARDELHWVRGDTADSVDHAAG